MSIVFHPTVYFKFCIYSGVLTGKFKRDSSPEKTGSRIGFIHSDEKRALQAAPAWSKYNGDDGYWLLLDAMKEIAEKHSKYCSLI